MKQLTNGKALPPPDEKLVSKARHLDGKIRLAVASSKQSFVNLAGLLAEMKVGKLWAVLADKDRPNGFRDFDDYGRAILGTFGKSRFYELLAINELVRGEHALSQVDVEVMGLKRGYELSRLEPEQRTPELVEVAMSQPLAIVRQRVQEVLNADLPKDRQKEPTATFVKVLTPEIIGRYEALEERAVWMKGICDHDPVLTAKQKLFLAMIISFETTHLEELEEADRRRGLHAQAEQAAKEVAAEADIPETIPETLEWTQKLKTPAVQPE